MAIGKAAGCLMLAGAMWLPAAQFTVRHEHWRKGCEGVLTVDERGISFAGAKGHAWSWTLQEIQEFQLSPQSIHILTYKDSKIRLGADRGYEFTGTIPADELYALLEGRMDQRLVARLSPAGARNPGEWSMPVKHLGRIAGSEGTLAFGADRVVYVTDARGESRTWRYSDLDGIGSSGAFELTLTTREKDFHFQLKQPLTEARYNFLWLQIEQKNGRIQ